MSVDVIGTNSQVTLHFALKLDDGQLVDSTFERDAAKLTIGDGNLLPGFEACLMSLKAGDHQTFTVAPENGFGQPNPQNVQRMKRSDFAVDMPLSPGLMVSFADAQGAELPGVIKEIEGDAVYVDFNHPLAGKELLFEVQVIEVSNAD
ncbi:peptidylprolyl isomerase [Bacterioplanes sanyensis]|uniref:Peptidyl-prolyl cis-trans isomerase n=1 Tax=Bacterioplanes sanyensis TaxID=1249553 RepID=A0A222FK07_9GAMM|nr:FKBP-type peptidyl-prolyl cis-trans isomerase [Bacterioplanes sanyensis]ASP38916.1 peptidylprolyl isomerase [Bacterioplanes sanyensis]